jgi:hypothetical protein
MYDKFIAMIEQLPSRASHVQEITLSHCFSKQYDKTILCALFPNLRLVRLIDTGENNTLCTKQPQIASIKPKMNEISDYGECELTRSLINANLCANLKILQVHLSSTYEKRSGVVPQLKNIPTLEYLTISDSYLTIDECEILHTNLPSVKNFSLDVVYLVESAIPHHIQPAVTITSLTWRVRVMSFQDIDTHLDWCMYMSRKYTTLTYFDFFDLECTDYGPDYINQLFRYGIFFILQANARYLQFLRVNCMPYGVNVFKALDDFGCKIQHLHIDPSENIPIFRDLAQSNQSNHIQKLSLENINIYPITLLKNMTALTTLSATCCLFGYDGEGMTINLNTLLTACPDTLKSLSISDFRLEFNFPTDHSTCIEKLHISCTNLTNTLCSIISTSLPKLNCLTLFGRVTQDLTLLLPNHHLSSFSINGRSNQSDYYLSLTLPEDHITRFYAIQDKKTTSNMPHLYRKKSIIIPFDELSERPAFSLQCGSISQMFLDFYKIDLV